VFGSNLSAGWGWGRVVLSALLAGAWLVLWAPGARADQVQCGQLITASTTIENSLSGCAGDGLVIGAGGVTLDLNGHTIEGVGLGVGVRNDGHDDVTIRNGTVKQFDHGVVLGPGTVRNAVTGIALAQNEWASIQLDDADANQVRHNQVTEFSDVGVHLVNESSGNLLEGNTIAGGNGEGFLVEGGSNSNRLEANAVTASSDNALRVDSSANTMVLANQIVGGSDVAILMSAAWGSVVQANTVTSGGDAAVVLSDSSAGVLRFNELILSQDAGIILSGVSDSLVKANSMSQAGDAAIILRAASNGNRVIDNQAHRSSDAGIFVSDGVSNTVRGNTLLDNAVGIEVSGGSLNSLEFNVVNSNLGIGVEISESGGNSVFANTVSNNLGGGIWVEPVEGVASDNRIAANAVHSNGADGMAIYDLGAVVTGNLATHNLGWGIYAVEGQVEAGGETLRVVDGGGNGASGNAEAAQCHLIVCSDGSGWQPPARPPEPLDPLEGGLPPRPSTPPGPQPAPLAPAPPTQGAATPQAPTQTAAAPQSSRSLAVPPPPAGRLALVRCKRRRAARGRTRVICKAPYRAKPTSRRLTGRLIRRGTTFAHGARRVRPGRPGSLTMLARRRPQPGRYMLTLTFRDARGRPTLIRKPVHVP
jgi:parallel beta-helix repeat protein